MSKDPEEYKDNQQKHVQIALKMAEQGVRAKSNDIIQYVIGKKNKCYHPSNVKNLKFIDMMALERYVHIHVLLLACGFLA